MLKRNQIAQKGFHYLFVSLLPLITSAVQADDLPVSNLHIPAISIIIDDMGYRLNSGNRAINLPGALTYSFLPHSPHAVSLSKSAHQQNKEVMLHLPMEAESGKKLGPGGLTECMTEQKFIKVLESSIKSVPYASGFNNHMGSLLTKSSLWMTRLMHEIASDKNLYFVDSKTTSQSIAFKVALEEGLKSIKRDIFIDHEESKEFIQQKLKKLIKRAKRKGTTLAIAHPKRITLSVLESWLPTLEMQGIKLVSVSTLIGLQQQKRLALSKPSLPNNAAAVLKKVKY